MIKKLTVFFSLFLTINYAYAVGTTIAVAVIGAGLAATAVGIAINFALSYVISQILAPNFGPQRQQETQDPGVRIQLAPDTTTTIPVVYGDAFLGARFVDAALTTDNKVMYYVLAISCISENGQFSYDTSKFYYGDRLVTFSGSDPSQVTSLTDSAGNLDTKINGNLSIHLYTSTTSGVINSVNTLNGLMPWDVMGSSSGLIEAQQWNQNNRKMNGLSFAIVKLTYNQDAGTTQLQPITFCVRQSLNNTGLAKPGDVWYDYMTNSLYGAAVETQYVDANSAIALNNYSDELITFKDYNGISSVQARYRINGVIDASDGSLDNVDKILIASDSWMQYNATNGRWAVFVNQASTTAYEFNDSNIIGEIIVGSIDITQMPNQIQGKFPDKTNRDQYNYVNLNVPQNLLYPNEPVNKININYELVNESVQTLYLANRVLEQAREDLLVTINTTYDGIQVDAGDVVSLTNTAYGWNNKLFRAMQVREKVDVNGLTAEIQLVEYNAQVYDNFDITQYAPAGNSGLVSANYFSNLGLPVVVNPQQNAAVPSFNVKITIPNTGRITFINLYYTTSATPSTTDFKLLDIQELSNSEPFANGADVIFSNISLPTGVYYFAYKVGNNVAQSNISALSAIFNWLPNPSTVAVAGTFIPSFSPSVLTIPYDTTPNFNGIVAELYGTLASGSADFVAAQSDGDLSFVNNTWRIGASSTTGYGDIIKSGINLPNPTDGGNFALFAQPTSMSTNPATLTVPVRYKNTNGIVTQASSASLQYNFLYTGASGPEGTKHGTAFLYQWSTIQPSNPTGTATFIWSTSTTTAYVGGGGWSTGIPANPGIQQIKLWVASKGVSAPGPDVTTTVSWASGFAVATFAENGANGAAGAAGLNGIQTANPTVFQWALSIPASPSGSSTYTWSNGSYTPIPSGWSLTPGSAPTLGFTLWGATFNLVESAAQTTTIFNWTSSVVTARGYSGTNGATGATGPAGATGATGQQGASARICYATTFASAMASSPAAISVAGTGFPPNGTWDPNAVWVQFPPSLIAGQSLYQSDGIFNPATNTTTWTTPYLSSLKVGSLSAITTNTGSLTVTGLMSSANGNFQVDANGSVLIRNAATGGRLQITNNQIAVFDSSNVLRVLLGQL